ncbi:hypothetical protein F2P79_013479 [Pimephales promelas]|nr:hypothetical protein F2P79_013479 [Pimephales promelas]
MRGHHCLLKGKEEFRHHKTQKSSDHRSAPLPLPNSSGFCEMGGRLLRRSPAREFSPPAQLRRVTLSSPSPTGVIPSTGTKDLPTGHRGTLTHQPASPLTRAAEPRSSSPANSYRHSAHQSRELSSCVREMQGACPRTGHQSETEEEVRLPWEQMLCINQEGNKQ